jgi:TonB-like protein
MVSTIKHVVLLIGSFALAMSAAATDPGVSFEYDNKFTWDKKQLDSPPLPIGGGSAISKGLDYPVDLRRRHIQGRTKLSVTVDPHGHVQSLRFDPHLPPQLEKIVTTAVYQCRWKPGQRHGRFVTGSVSFPVRFVIEKRKR